MLFLPVNIVVKITFFINECVTVANIVNMIFYLRRHPALQVRNFVYFLANSNYDTLIVFSVSCQQVPEPIKQVESSLHSNCCILRANLGYTVVWIMSQRILIHLRGTFPSLSAVTGFLRLTQSWLPSQISQTAFLFPEILNRHKVSQKLFCFAPIRNV